MVYNEMEYQTTVAQILMKNRSTTFSAIKYVFCKYARVTWVDQWVKSLSPEVNLKGKVIPVQAAEGLRVARG
jgi:hypothetical protein